MDMTLNSSPLFAYVTCDCITQVLADMDARDYARTRCLRVHVGWWWPRVRGRSHAHGSNEKKNTPYLANISSNSNALTRVVRNHSVEFVSFSLTHQPICRGARLG